MGKNLANPLAAILSAALMLEYLADKTDEASLSLAADAIETAISKGFQERSIRPVELGGDMGTREVTSEVLRLI